MSTYSVHRNKKSIQGCNNYAFKDVLNMKVERDIENFRLGN